MKTDISHQKINSDCLSRKMLIDYSKNRLSTKEMHEIEKHLLKCELCSDAVEGFSMHPNIQSEADIDQALLKSNRKIRNPISLYIRYAGIAASFILVLGGMIVLYQILQENKDHENRRMAIRSEKTENLVSPSSPEVPKEGEKEISEIQYREDKLISAPKFKEEHLNQKTDILFTKDEGIEENKIGKAAAGEVEDNNTLLESKAVVAQIAEEGLATSFNESSEDAKTKAVRKSGIANPAVGNYSFSASPQEADQKTNSTAGLSKKKEERTSRDKSKNAIEPSVASAPAAVDNSLKEKAEVTKPEAENISENLLNEGKFAFNEKRYNDAIKILKKFLKQKPSIHTYEGKTYLGLSYVQTGEIAKAKKIFKEIISSDDGLYRGIALEEMQKLDKK